MNENLKDTFERANSSLEQLANELEGQNSSVDLDTEEMKRLKAVVDRVRQILWQMQQKIGEKRLPQR